MAIMVPMHTSGIPHVDQIVVGPAVQWGVLGVIVLVGAWLAFDARGTRGSGGAVDEDRPAAVDGPLVAGRRRGSAVSATAAPVDPEPNQNDAPEHPVGRSALPPDWVNPIRVLTAVLGIVAGIQATDRVREIMQLDAALGTVGTLQVSRVALALAVLLCVGGAVAMPAPRLAAAAFAAAATLAGLCTQAGRWEARLEWWGAGYALTAWSNLWVWALIGAGLAGLATLGWWYRPGMVGRR